mmetsp:Transcript_18477/g.28517  ORF Transcript_18477/g.28517 Transcript_18477/m.28517 type:complete len:392 (-) Transcript_18477:1703-2878(-)|eukprot:CAMPEP_0195288432 /NCGR_PEP_ID=MMETSP0707-20130614/5103_1 /TAXON_ID=33640 /ORGANISM="Asterionellopsis glacialis, Strain CCMP134" /LENGTH=391 /DNA_ID=CAMNT_0040348301 /DNA_START=105 /DNA_END=1280 /DNA_ORIENTATION=-
MADAEVDEAPTQEQAATAPSSSNNRPKTDYNPRWKGYSLIATTSFVSFVATTNVDQADVEDYRAAGIVFGVVTCALSVVILIFDRFQVLSEKFNFSKSKDGKLEGFTLLAFVIWWMAGVSLTTRVGGVAYKSLNIYFASWLSLAACIYTLNDWSKAKDILTIHELTRLSLTLTWWWVLFLSSIVTMASAVDMHRIVSERHRNDASFGIALGLISSAISLVFILEHYNLLCFPGIKHGGWMEMVCIFLLFVCWIIAASLMTQDGGIASGVVGIVSNQLEEIDLPEELDNENCGKVPLYYNDSSTNTLKEMFVLDTCSIAQDVPGSNLYFSSWTCLISCLILAFRWKAAQALQFAQAQETNVMRNASLGGRSRQESNSGDDDPHDEDVDDDAI